MTFKNLMVSSSFACLLISTIGLMAASANASESELAGKTIIASGDVNAFTPEDKRTLSRRSPIYKIDKVTTADDSQAQFKMIDGGIVALQANTELEIASYQYDQETNTGSAVMNLISGGLRTISGKIKSYNGNYTLNTPAGSIGVRGTHFEVEILGDELFLAVWDGAVDFKVSRTGKLFSFGENENFNYAKIQQTTGAVKGLLNPPAVFESGYAVPENQASKVKTGPSKNETISIAVQASKKRSPVATEILTSGKPTSSGVASELNPSELKKDSDLFALQNPIAERVGVTKFELVNHNFTSSMGDVSDANMEMTVNFDKQRVVTGFLSFNDEGGKWSARFNGAINQAKLELDVLNASHGKNRAEGEINGEFTSDNQARGSLFFNEIKMPSVSAGGEFELAE